MTIDPQNIAVVVPAYNEEANLPRLLQELLDNKFSQIVVADGGSTDNTVAVADKFGATVAPSDLGRGVQINTGIQASQADYIWVLHADSGLPGHPVNLMAPVLAQGDAGAFRLAIDHPSFKFRLIELGTQIRVGIKKIPYGDQGLFFPRALYDQVQGFPNWPLMEDVGFVERIKMAGQDVKIVPASLKTSPRRWLRDGLIRRTLRNWVLMRRFRAGTPPEALVPTYQVANKS